MRITGGKLRSRRLVSPKGDATRPTSDRVREALFSILGSRVVDAHVLDLFAGTGALGLEALSRGARKAVLVDRAREAVLAIRENVATMKLEADVRIVSDSAERAVASLAVDEPFDLVFVDPPYRSTKDGTVVEVLETLARRGLLASGARIVLEHANRDPPPELVGMLRVDSRSYGDTALAFYEESESGEEPESGETQVQDV